MANDCSKCIHHPVCKTAVSCDGYVSGCEHFVVISNLETTTKQKEGQTDVREKLVELIGQVQDCGCDVTDVVEMNYVENITLADYLIANGATVQADMTELIGRGLDNIYWRIYGANKEFNERMAGYNPSSFCAGFQYAIQLAKGLLTQLPQPPKGE